MVALTGRHEVYYSDYRGRPREFVAAAKHGFLYQGQRYQWQRQARGTPTLDLPAECFVVFLQNHDQIANSGTGERCHALTSPGRLRAMTAYFLLMPGIPMLFQGQEFGASSPFFYFADHEIELSHNVREGRRRSLAQFPSLATSEMRAEFADPGDIDTFRRSVLDLGERQRHASIYALHRDLLELRRTDAVLGQRPCRVDGAENAALRLDHAQAHLLKFREVRADAILHHDTFVTAVIGLSDCGIDANLGGYAAHDELGDAAVLQHRVEIGGVECTLTRLVDDRLSGRRGKLRDDVVSRLATHQY